MASKSKSTALIVKTMGVFSGVQVISILVSVVRTKLVAIWIGAVGVGLFGVFNTVLDLLGNFAQMGMNTVAARELAAHDAQEQRVRYILMVRRICLSLGLLFALLTIGFSPLLSRWAFGDGDMTWWFCLLSIAIFAMAVSGGEGGILMGLHKLRGIALATTWGNVIGLAVTVPLFFFWRATAIVPSIVILYIITTSILWNYAHKATSEIMPDRSHGITWRSSLADGFHIIKLGFYIIISVMMINLGSYLFLVYLNRTADTATVGYFQSGFTLINRYVGLVFAALMVDFFPRLSMCQRSRRAMSVTVSQELSVIMGIMVPLVLLFIAFVPVIIEVLYTSDFQIIQPMVHHRNRAPCSVVYHGLCDACQGRRLGIYGGGNHECGGLRRREHPLLQSVGYPRHGHRLHTVVCRLYHYGRHSLSAALRTETFVGHIEAVGVGSGGFGCRLRIGHGYRWLNYRPLHRRNRRRGVGHSDIARIDRA